MKKNSEINLKKGNTTFLPNKWFLTIVATLIGGTYLISHFAQFKKTNLILKKFHIYCKILIPSFLELKKKIFHVWQRVQCITVNSTIQSTVKCTSHIRVQYSSVNYTVHSKVPYTVHYSTVKYAVHTTVQYTVTVTVQSTVHSTQYSVIHSP